MNLDIETVLTVAQTQQKNKERVKSRVETASQHNKSHLSKRPTISLVPRQSSMFNNRSKEDKTKKVVKLRGNQAPSSQRYKEELGKEKHNVSVTDEQKNVSGSQQKHKRSNMVGSSETEMTRQMRIAQSYQDTQSTFKVRQELRPSTIEISSAIVRLSSPVSMNGLAGGMIVKQPTSTQNKQLYSGLQNVPNPVLAKPRD